MTENRIKSFYNSGLFDHLQGLPEAITNKENENNYNLGNSFSFSNKTYDTETGGKIDIGRIGEWYFIGTDRFQIFEDKKLLLLEINTLYDLAKENNPSEPGESVSRSWVGFWSREVESL